MADIDAKKVELLPCPFCGSPADIFYDSDNEANVFCTSDDCDAQIFGAKEARCIEKWNRRASLPLAGNVEGDALYLASTLRKWGHVGPRLCEKSADEIDRLLGVIRSLSSRVEAEKRAREEAERWKGILHKQVDDFAERYAQAGQDANKLRVDLRSAETHSAALARALEEARDELLECKADYHRNPSSVIDKCNAVLAEARSLLASRRTQMRDGIPLDSTNQI